MWPIADGLLAGLSAREADLTGLVLLVSVHSHLERPSEAAGCKPEHPGVLESSSENQDLMESYHASSEGR